MESSIEESRENESSTEQIIRDCFACSRECTSCISHCLSHGGHNADEKHITLLMECAEVCRLSAVLIQLKTEFAFEHAQVCAKICDACADSCSKIDQDDNILEKCVYMCKRCSESCRSMSP